MNVFLPRAKGRRGFMDLLLLTSYEPPEATIITVWESKRAFENAGGLALAKELTTRLGPVLTAAPTTREYDATTPEDSEDRTRHSDLPPGGSPPP